jgi:DNA-binding HxlR family transcriptional regulator
MNKVKTQNYITIQGWMLNIGCKSMQEVAAYALVYGFSQDDCSQFSGRISYIQEWLMCSRHTAINTMKSLEDKGLIKKEQYEVNGIKFNRYTALGGSANSALLVQTALGGSANSALHNNNINNISPVTLSNDKDNVPKGERGRFVKPTVNEIASYCRERNNNIDAQEFYDFYESKGWVIGKSPMKDWKAAVRTWEKNHKKSQSQQENHVYQ